MRPANGRRRSTLLILGNFIFLVCSPFSHRGYCKKSRGLNFCQWFDIITASERILSLAFSGIYYFGKTVHVGKKHVHSIYWIMLCGTPASHIKYWLRASFAYPFTYRVQNAGQSLLRASWTSKFTEGCPSKISCPTQGAPFAITLCWFR